MALSTLGSGTCGFTVGRASSTGDGSAGGGSYRGGASRGQHAEHSNYELLTQLEYAHRDLRRWQALAS